jgi:hypothetical protein
MSYLTVITLERAKHYLRLDLGFNDDDNEITSMIKAACLYVEKRTNHILFERNKVYTGACQVKVYDYPINLVVTTPIPFLLKRSLYTIYPDVKEVELNVGYAVNAVPDDLIQPMLQMIKVWYYESEKQVNSTLIPESVKEALDLNKRFL